MNREIGFSVQELLGEGPICGFLSEEEIEALADGRLDPRRRAAWEEHAGGCAFCSELRDDLQAFLRLAEGEDPGTFSERRAFRKSRARVEAAIGAERRHLFRLVRLGVVAAALALTALVLILGLPRRTSPSLIAEIESVPLVPPPVVRGVAVETWNEARTAWDSGNFDEAAVVLEEAAAGSTSDPALLFYLGVARLRADDAAGAEEALRRADALERDVPSDSTRWMLATALDRLGRTEEACEVLRSVAGLGGAHADRAEKITRTSCP